MRAEKLWGMQERLPARYTAVCECVCVFMCVLWLLLRICISIGVELKRRRLLVRNQGWFLSTDKWLYRFVIQAWWPVSSAPSWWKKIQNTFVRVWVINSLFLISNESNIRVVICPHWGRVICSFGCRLWRFTGNFSADAPLISVFPEIGSSSPLQDSEPQKHVIKTSLVGSDLCCFFVFYLILSRPKISNSEPRTWSSLR